MNLDKAILIASKAHQGQVDKGGVPYILHPLRIMLECRNEEEQICAVLHDIVEDTDITFEDLKIEGFSDNVLNAIDALTKRSQENYDDFIDRVLKNQIACKVKLADLCDNMDLCRIPNPTQKDYERVEKYGKAADKIIDELKSKEDTALLTSKEIEINGCVSVPASCSHDEFLDKFIKFIERNHWYFGGGTKEV